MCSRQAFHTAIGAGDGEGLGSVVWWGEGGIFCVPGDVVAGEGEVWVLSVEGVGEAEGGVGVGWDGDVGFDGGQYRC